MTKTTNYEISKKLAEIGFKKNSTIGWFTSKCGGGGRFYILDGIRDGYTLEYYSFDLETLLDVLPDIISGCLIIHKKGMYYQQSTIEVAKLENEALADTAGRLIIELYNNNLIKSEIKELEK
jgi:hypothetical protein